jgi:hypothetical protein
MFRSRETQDAERCSSGIRRIDEDPSATRQSKKGLAGVTGSRFRSPGDEARRDLYFTGKALRTSGRAFPSRETVLSKGGSLEDLAFHMTIDNVRRLDDETALLLRDWNSDVMGWRIGASTFRQVLEHDPDDDFFSDSREVERAPIERIEALVEPKPTARPPRPNSLPGKAIHAWVQRYLQDPTNEHHHRDSDIMAAIQSDYPGFTIPRDPLRASIRAILGSRTPGPKQKRGQNPRN